MLHRQIQFRNHAKDIYGQTNDNQIKEPLTHKRLHFIGLHDKPQLQKINVYMTRTQFNCKARKNYATDNDGLSYLQ